MTGPPPWWDDNRPLAPEAFDEDVSEVFSLLSAQPGIGVPVTNARTPGVKRLHLARIHYFLYHRVRGEEVQVLRIWHTSRGTALILVGASSAPAVGGAKNAVV